MCTVLYSTTERTTLLILLYYRYEIVGVSDNLHSDLTLQNPGKSASCHDSVSDIQYFTVYNDVIFSHTVLYCTHSLASPVPGGGGGEFGVLPVLLFGRPIQNMRHFLLESFVWEEAIRVTILWREDSVT